MLLSSNPSREFDPKVLNLIALGDQMQTICSLLILLFSCLCFFPKIVHNVQKNVADYTFELLIPLYTFLCYLALKSSPLDLISNVY